MSNELKKKVDDAIQSFDSNIEKLNQRVTSIVNDPDLLDKAERNKVLHKQTLSRLTKVYHATCFLAVVVLILVLSHFLLVLSHFL